MALRFEMAAFLDRKGSNRTIPEADPIVRSVVIPAYNEAPRFPSYLREVVGFFERRGEPFEVIVVDDGSEDTTREQVCQLQASHRQIQLITFHENHGKGFAVKAGMENARGTFRLFTDTDGATPIQELDRLESALQNGADIAIGSRALSPYLTVDLKQ